MCRFGYTFNEASRSENVVESSTENKVGTTRRRSRINIDPRRRQHSSTSSLTPSATESAFTSTSAPVTIKIGGVSIVIPDFDLPPRETKTKEVQEPRKDGSQRIENSLNRPKINKKRNRKKPKNQNQKTFNRQSNKTKILKLFHANNIKRKPSARSRSKPRITTTTVTTTTEPSIIVNTILDSFDTLQKSVTNSVASTISSSATSSPFQIFTTTKPTTQNRNKGRQSFSTFSRSSTTRSQELSTTPQPPSSELSTRKGTTLHRVPPTSTLSTPAALKEIPKVSKKESKNVIKVCPESLGACVDACVPLQVMIQ